MSDWDTYAVCPGCDRKYRAPFGKSVHLHFEVCPACGEPDARWNGRFGSGWPVRILRVIDGRWFERDVSPHVDILAAEAAEEVRFRRGCFSAIALLVALSIAAIWGGLT